MGPYQMMHIKLIPDSFQVTCSSIIKEIHGNNGPPRSVIIGSPNSMFFNHSDKILKTLNCMEPRADVQRRRIGKHTYYPIG